MRKGFHRDLEALRADLGRMCVLAGVAARHATCALLDTDAEIAERALADVRRISALRNSVERRAVELLALQAPVASDLRAVVASIRIAADADRMGGLAGHVARLCLRRHPAAVLPDELRDTFATMSQLAVDLSDQCQAAVLTGCSVQARRVCDGDAAMEDLHRSLFEAINSPRWSHGVAVAADVALLGRFYGRFADHAGEIAHRVMFQETGSPALKASV
jgi:phosphate transport system protein